MTQENFNIGQEVNAEITKNGYYHSSYNGIVVGFTKNGRIKVKSWRGIKCHSKDNVAVGWVK